jgi:adenosylcobinamide-GDP ribazoletransferase
MKDSRHGTYGVAAMCASIVVRVAAIAAVPGPGAMFAVAVAAHVLARAGAVLLMATLPLATGRGLGVDYGKNTSPARAAAATVAGLAIAGVAVGWWAGPLFLAAVIAACLVGLLARRKIGGLSGDVLGAAEQVGECLVMLVGGVIALRHPLWWGS